MKKWMGLIVMVVVMTFVMPVSVQASAEKAGYILRRKP